MGCRVVANLLSTSCSDTDSAIEQQAIAAVAAAIGARAFTESWRLSIEGGETSGSIVFSIQGPGFRRRFRYSGPPNQVGRFIRAQVLGALRH